MSIEIMNFHGVTRLRMTFLMTYLRVTIKKWQIQPTNTVKLSFSSEEKGNLSFCVHISRLLHGFCLVMLLFLEKNCHFKPNLVSFRFEIQIFPSPKITIASFYRFELNFNHEQNFLSFNFQNRNHFAMKNVQLMKLSRIHFGALFENGFCDV